MKNQLKNFLIKNKLIGPVRRIKRLFSKNLYKNAEKEGFMPSPSFVVIENTSLCNLKCKMCYINFIKFKKKGLDLEKWKRIIGKFPDSVKKIILIGGEPLLMPGVFELIKYIESKNIEPIICTNATLITDKNIKELAKTKAISHINISIDGKKELHNFIRGVPTAFDNMVRGIKLVKQYGGKIESVTTVIQDENFDKLKEVVEVMNKLGIKNLLLEFERRYNDKIIKESGKILGLSSEEIIAKESINLKHKFTVKQLKKSLEETEKLARKYGICIEYLPNNFKKDISFYLNRKYRYQNKRFVCDYLPVARIDCQGNLINCPVIRKKIGNLLEKDFNDLWNSEEFRRYRKKLLLNNLVPVCDTCFQCKPFNEFKSLIN